MISFRTKAILFSALLVMGSLLILPETSATAVDAVNWGAPGAPIESAPGDTAVPLSISIRNSDQATYTNVKAVLGAVDEIAPMPSGETSALSGNFAPGSVWVAKFYVNIAPNASVGTTYALPLTIYLTYAGGPGVSFTQPFTANVMLTGRPSLRILATPPTIGAGEEQAVTLTVQNAGNGPAGAIVLTLAAPTGSPLSLVRTSNTFDVGSLIVGATKDVPVTLRAAASTSGAATLTAGLSYNGAAGGPVAQTRTLSFDVVDGPPSGVATSLLWTDVARGQAGTLAFQVKDISDAAVTNVTVSAVPSQGAALVANGDASLSIATLAPGAANETGLPFLSTSATADVAQVDVTTTWQAADGALHSHTFTQTIRLAPPTRASVAASLAEDHLDSGRVGTLTFHVTNGQTTSLHALTATLVSTSTAFSVLGATDVQVLGTMDAGASADAVVRVLSSNSATGIQQLKLQLDWQGADGGARSQSYSFGIAILGTVQFSVTGGSGTFDPTSGSGAISATLTNLGNAIAHNAYVSIGPGPAYAPSQETYLGDINPNTALPFTLQTTLLNKSLLTPQNASRNAARAGGNGSGNFPAGDQGGSGNRTGGFGGRGGFGGFRGSATNATFEIRWNDEYGATHSATYSVAASPRATATTSSASSTRSTSASGGVPTMYVVVGAGVVGLVGIGAYVVRRKRLSDQLDEE